VSETLINETTFPSEELKFLIKRSRKILGIKQSIPFIFQFQPMKSLLLKGVFQEDKIKILLDPSIEDNAWAMFYLANAIFHELVHFKQFLGHHFSFKLKSAVPYYESEAYDLASKFTPVLMRSLCNSIIRRVRQKSISFETSGEKTRSFENSDKKHKEITDFHVYIYGIEKSKRGKKQVWIIQKLGRGLLLSSAETRWVPRLPRLPSNAETWAPPERGEKGG